jgi:hypothetical protein
METVEEESSVPRSKQIWGSVRERFLKSPASSLGNLLGSSELRPHKTLSSVCVGTIPPCLGRRGLNHPPSACCHIIAWLIKYHIR